MPGRTGTLLTGLLLVVAGCTTTTAPTPSLAVDDVGPGDLAGVRFLPSAPALTTYDTTFVVIQGESSEHRVPYDGPSEDVGAFLLIDIPRNAEFVDAEGHLLPEGSVVPVRVQIARDSLALKFAPHGSTFRRPVKLLIDYTYTDLAGAGAVELKMWYQASDGLTWTQVPVSVEVDDDWLKIDLKHFSNYAVAF